MPLSPLDCSAAVAVVMVHVRPYGRRCRASAGSPESTGPPRGTPAGCGPPARSHLPQEPGSSRSAAKTWRKKTCEHQSTSEILSHCTELPKKGKKNCNCSGVLSSTNIPPSLLPPPGSTGSIQLCRLLTLHTNVPRPV